MASVVGERWCWPMRSLDVVCAETYEQVSWSSLFHLYISSVLPYLINPFTKHLASTTDCWMPDTANGSKMKEVGFETQRRTTHAEGPAQQNLGGEVPTVWRRGPSGLAWLDRGHMKQWDEDKEGTWAKAALEDSNSCEKKLKCWGHTRCMVNAPSILAVRMRL